jgi:hypothetical protein
MSSKRFSVRLDISHVAESLTGVHNAVVKCLFVIDMSCELSGKDPEVVVWCGVVW